MKQHTSWKRLARTTIYSTPHLRVHEDTVQLPGGVIINDYSVVEMNDVVMCVTTDEQGNVLVLEEYRYAIDETMLNLPAGTFQRGAEDIVVAAQRELLEETGYSSDDISIVGELHDFPTKATHVVHVLRVRNARKTAEQNLEDTEDLRLTLMRPEELKKLIFENQVKTTSVLSAVVLAMPELFGCDA
jgi:ADP-ribose pyrophosphatase